MPKKKFIWVMALCPTVLIAQDREPVVWNHRVDQQSENSYSVIFIASITQGWHIYSQYLQRGGPMPTKFSFNSDKSFRLIASTLEHGNLVSNYDSIYEMDVSHFTGLAQFKQTIWRETKNEFVVHARVEYMACNEAMCIPAWREFVISIE
jgi:hypothetical protein